MRKINLLLEDKNKGILTSESFAILSAFRNGEFIVDGERVSIGKYIGKESKFCFIILKRWRKK